MSAEHMSAEQMSYRGEQMSSGSLSAEQVSGGQMSVGEQMSSEQMSYLKFRLSKCRLSICHGTGISHLQLLCSYSSGCHDVKILWSTSRVAGISSGFSVNVANILCTKCFNVGPYKKNYMFLVRIFQESDARGRYFILFFVKMIDTCS